MSYCVAIVLAAGQGRRMGSKVAKQFLEIRERPVLYYSLKQFEDSFIDEVVLVARENDISFCRDEVVNKYGFHKVKSIVAGGKERYHSVYQGLCAIKECDYVFIHDGARPFIDQDILHRNLSEVKIHDACVTGMPVKDTIKKRSIDYFVEETPARELLWQIQTPQTFSFPIIRNAYAKFLQDEENNTAQYEVTDDAMVAEIFGGISVKLVEGSYRNVKITTPEDLILAEAFVKAMETAGQE